jgi:hypothetical protein
MRNTAAIQFTVSGIGSVTSSLILKLTPVGAVVSGKMTIFTRVNQKQLETVLFILHNSFFDFD